MNHLENLSKISFDSMYPYIIWLLLFAPCVNAFTASTFHIVRDLSLNGKNQYQFGDLSTVPPAIQQQQSVRGTPPPRPVKAVTKPAVQRQQAVRGTPVKAVTKPAVQQQQAVRGTPPPRPVKAATKPAVQRQQAVRATPPPRPAKAVGKF